MPRVAPIVPTETDVLCEGCGYTLNGLPETGNCPECGRPIAQSAGAQHRVLPAWEQPHVKRGRAFGRVTLDVLLRPTHFYRTLATRADASAARRFAEIHWLVASNLLGVAAYLHWVWYRLSVLGVQSPRSTFEQLALMLGGPLLIAFCYIALAWTTRLAARLTHWEANYRGIRLPMPVVRRGLYYHAAHYLPVGLVALATVGGYQLLLARGVLSAASATRYLYVLSGEVILCAIYLFNTYWIGMRNMMYANR